MLRIYYIIQNSFRPAPRDKGPIINKVYTFESRQIIIPVALGAIIHCCNAKTPIVHRTSIRQITKAERILVKKLSYF